MESYNLTEAYLEIYEAYNEKGEFIREPNSAHSGETISRPPAVRSSPEAIKARNAHREVLRRQREQEKLKTPEQIEAERQERMRKARAILNPQSSNESYELIISYLLDEGYASDIESAESIYDSMSEGWKTDVLKSTLKTTGKVLKGGAKIMNKTGVGKKVRRFATRTALGAVGIPMISE